MYEELDSSIVDNSNSVIIDYDSSMLWVGKNIEPTQLTIEEIKEIDKMIIKYIDDYNAKKEIFHNKMKSANPHHSWSLKDLQIDLKDGDYKRQIVPYLDRKSGEKNIWVNFFCDDWSLGDKQKIVEIEDGGNCYFQLKINLETKTVYDFMVNGFA